MQQQLNFPNKKLLFTIIILLLVINTHKTFAIEETRKVIASEATLSSGVGLDQGLPFIANSFLQFVPADDITKITKIVAVDTKMQAIDINGKSSDDNTNLQCIGDCSLGSVTDLSGNKQKIIVIIDQKNEEVAQKGVAHLTLTGSTFPDARAKINDYTGISQIVLNSATSTLDIKSDSVEPQRQVIEFDGEFKISKDIKDEAGKQAQTSGVLNVLDHFIVRDKSIADIKQINIGNESKAETLTVNFCADGRFDRDSKDDQGRHFDFMFSFLPSDGQINFKNKKSSLQLQNNGSGNGLVMIHAPLALVSNAGIVNLQATQRSDTLTILGDSASLAPGDQPNPDDIRGTVGTDDKRLNQLTASGAGNFNVEAAVFADSVEANSTSTSTLTFYDDVTVTESINFHDASTAVAKADIIGNIDYKNHNANVTIEAGHQIDGKVISTEGANGNLNFLGDGEVTGNIGDDTKNGIKNVNIKQGEVKLADANTDINFNGASTLLANGNITGKVNYDKFDAKVILADNKKIIGNVSSTRDKTGELTFKNGGMVIGNVGDEQNAIKVINIQQGTVEFASNNPRAIDISGLLPDHARLIRLQDKWGYKPNYKTEIVVDNLNISNNGKAQFNDAAFIGKSLPNGTIKGGNLEFKDDVWLNNAIEKVDKIKFAANKFAVLANNIEAQEINAEQAKVIIANDMSIKGGNFTAPDMLFDLGDKTLTFGIAGEFKGTLTINATYNSAAPLESGYIKIAADGKMQLSEIDKVAINVFIAGNQPVAIGTKYLLVQPEDDEDSNDNIIEGLKDRPTTIVQLNKEQAYFTEWVVDEDGKNLILYSTEQKVDVSQGWGGSSITGKGSGGTGTSCNARIIQNLNATSEQQKFAQQLVNVVGHNSDAAKFKHMICDMQKAGRIEESREAANRLISRTVPFFAVMDSIVFAATQEIHNRISELGRLLNNQVPTIQSAGEEVRQRSGGWASAFYSQASQKLKNEISGYKLKASGGMIGIDSQINDNLLIGGAYSRSQAIISHKNAKNGDKTKANVNIFLLYGLQHLTDRWYVEGILSYATTLIPLQGDKN